MSVPATCGGQWRAEMMRYQYYIHVAWLIVCKWWAGSLDGWISRARLDDPGVHASLVKLVHLTRTRRPPSCRPPPGICVPCRCHPPAAVTSDVNEYPITCISSFTLALVELHRRGCGERCCQFCGAWLAAAAARLPVLYIPVVPLLLHYPMCFSTFSDMCDRTSSKHDRISCNSD